MTDLLSKEAVADIYTAVVHVEAQQDDDARLSAGFEVEQLLEKHGGYHTVMRRLIDKIRTNERERVQHREAAEKNPRFGFASSKAILRMVEGQSRFCSVYPQPTRAYSIGVYLDQPLTSAERERLAAYDRAAKEPVWDIVADRFLPECLKADEISGEQRGARIAELIRWFDRFYLGNANPKWLKSHTAELCYYILTSPPLPVVPDEKPMPNSLSMYAVDAVAAIAEVKGWNACRAAMLQSGNSEQVNEPTISFYRDGIVAAAQWVERTREAYDSEHGRHDPDTGTFEFGNDAQQEYSETLRDIEEGIRALHPNAGSNYPAIPEGWALVPVTADSEMVAAAIACGVTRGMDGALYVSYDDIYAAMVAAAPQRKDGTA